MSLKFQLTLTLFADFLLQAALMRPSQYAAHAKRLVPGKKHCHGGCTAREDVNKINTHF